jgi:hypothetical protein
VSIVFVSFFWRGYKSQKLQISKLVVEVITLCTLTAAFSTRIIIQVLDRTDELGSNGFSQFSYLNYFDAVGLNPFWNSLTLTNNYEFTFWTLTLNFIGALFSVYVIRYLLFSKINSPLNAALPIISLVILWILTNFLLTRGGNNYSHFRVFSIFTPVLFFLHLKSIIMRINSRSGGPKWEKSSLFFKIVSGFLILFVTFSNHALSKSHHAGNFDYFETASKNRSYLVNSKVIASTHDSIVQLASFRSLEWLNRTQTSLEQSLAKPLESAIILLSPKNPNFLECKQSANLQVTVGSDGMSIVKVEVGMDILKSESNLHLKIGAAFGKPPISGDTVRALGCL